MVNTMSKASVEIKVKDWINEVVDTPPKERTVTDYHYLFSK
jgi:hypothetical protein